MRSLGFASAAVLCFGYANLEAQGGNLDAARMRCRQDGLIASGVFVQSVWSGRSGALPVERATSDFVLRCEANELVLSLTETGQRPQEHWRVVDITGDTMFSDNRLRIVFSRLGGVNLLTSLNLSDLKGIRAEGAFPVVMLLDLSSGMRQFFGRLSYVAPAYQRDIPIHRSTPP